MASGERIHFFRTMRGMTQKYLGMALGFRRNPQMSALRSTKWLQDPESGCDRCAGTGA